MPKLIRWGLIALGVIVLGFALNTGRQYLRWSPFNDTPGERATRLAEHWRLVLPEGPGPYPAAILLSGCDGVRDNMDYWAAMFVETGRAALIVDSHTPRGLDELESWRLVCAGQALSGAERAGDVAVAIDALAEMEDVSDDIVLFGASHGGWTAMEFVTHAAAGEKPPGLERWPEPPDTLLDRVSALILLYPYCGVLNASTPEHWRVGLPTLLVLAENDTIISTPECIALAEDLDPASTAIEIDILIGADHGFDQREKSLFSTLEFDVDQRDRAREIVSGFLQDHALH